MTAGAGEAAWELYGALLQDRPKPYVYRAGTWGPAEADELLQSSRTEWWTR